MAEATTKDRPATVEKYVYDGVRAAGGKMKDLTPEQLERAQAAPKDKAGLRGKAVGLWVLDGEDLSAQAEHAKQTRAVRDADARSKRASAASKGRGSAYPEDVRAAVKRSNELRGKSHGAGPKQHVQVRKVATAELKKQGVEPTPLSLAKLAGFDSVAELHAAPAEMPREGLARLRPLAAKMGDDPWCKGRHLAGALAAWAEQLQGAKKAA